MTFYLVVFALLWLGVFFSTARGEILIDFELLALIAFILIAGQRFETGNDWLIYRDHYIALQNFGLDAGENPQFPVFEPLYALLVWMIGYLFDFQIFLLLVALFNGIVLYRFARAWRASFLGLFAIYYAWIYLATQMATIRYSLAISFVLLALISLMRHKKWLAFTLLLISAGFHLFSLVFIVLFAVLGRNLNFRWAFAALLGGFVAIYATLHGVEAGYLAWLPFSEKITFYMEGATSDHLSAGSAAYIALNFIFFLWLMRSQEADIRTRIAKWSVFLLLFSQVALWMLPIFWNRVQIFTLIIQACVLSVYFVERRRLISSFFVCLLSLGMLVKFLADPAYVSYIPYQSYWVELFLPGTARGGEGRFYDAIDANRDRGAR
ncbi:EpsG family protein [Cupriavidus metallidurans]|uniref:EpsG family protein n=1 Tax=Cupriavidus metallidurans TaxID=119219 RepID=UPI001CCF607A|nr:EpsG family protein [Cupriavidus metallidurans]UBM11717.1 EpsG family protein [Cupriavidus metallidurans]